MEAKIPALLIVGNGFDLNLNLKTSYKDFLDSGEFRSKLSRENKNNLFEYLHQKHQIEKWVDVEKELGNYCLEVLYRGNKPSNDHRFETLKDEYEELCQSLADYLNRVCRINFQLDSNNACIQLLKDINGRWDLPVQVVTFNYTDIIDRINDSPYSGIRAEVFHIHGETGVGKGIVFGVEDSVGLRREHQFLYKSHSKHKNAYGFYNRLNNTDNIIFFGYSLGETDHSYFMDFFEELTKPHEEKKRLIFYYHGESARDELIWQLRQLTNGRYTQLEMYNEIKFINSQLYESPF